jgi:hypothetical protein
MRIQVLGRILRTHRILLQTTASLEEEGSHSMVSVELHGGIDGRTHNMD